MKPNSCLMAGLLRLPYKCRRKDWLTDKQIKEDSEHLSDWRSYRSYRYSKYFWFSRPIICSYSAAVSIECSASGRWISLWMYNG